MCVLKNGQIDVKSKKKNKKKRKREKEEAKNQLYAGFTKSATLTNGKMVEETKSNENENNSSSEDEEMDKFSAVTKLLSDETLFKEAGITAHKGARHGKYSSILTILAFHCILQLSLSLFGIF